MKILEGSYGGSVKTKDGLDKSEETDEEYDKRKADFYRRIADGTAERI